MFLGSPNGSFELQPYRSPPQCIIQVLANVRWRQECAAKVGLGFMLPEDQNNPLLDRSGQVFEVEIAEAVSQ